MNINNNDDGDSGALQEELDMHQKSEFKLSSTADWSNRGALVRVFFPCCIRNIAISPACL